MANVKQQADNCLALFKGSPVGTIERAISNLGSSVVEELCSRFNCSKDQLTLKISNS